MSPRSPQLEKKIETKREIENAPSNACDLSLQQIPRLPAPLILATPAESSSKFESKSPAVATQKRHNSIELCKTLNAVEESESQALRSHVHVYDSVGGSLQMNLPDSSRVYDAGPFNRFKVSNVRNSARDKGK